jgi:tetratricopeptide (TPR) repeat protein
MALTMALSAEVAYSTGDLEQAEVFADQARERVEQSLSPLRRAKVGNVLGRLLRSLGRHPEAQRLHSQAYKVAAAISFRIEEAYALAGLAATAVALGDTVAADVHHTAAEELFALLGVPTDRRRRPAAQFTQRPSS